MVEYVVTYISHGDALSDSEIEEITSKIELELGIKVLRSCRLGQRASDTFFEITIKGSVKDSLNGVIDAYTDIDIIVQVNNDTRQNKKLMVFDMDSTLIYQEVIELIASYANVEEKVREITDLAMNNEINFKESLRQRVRLLKGLEIESLYDEIKQKLRITNGVKELVRFMQNTQKDCKFSVLSGGFIQFAEFIATQLNFDYKRANLLEVDSEGKLTGETIGDIVDGQYKAETILQLHKNYKIDRQSSVMVGDGGNDLPAMGVAGFGIAWNAKPKVQKQAPCKLNSTSMLDVLYIFGYTQEQIEAGL